MSEPIIYAVEVPSQLPLLIDENDLSDILHGGRETWSASFGGHFERIRPANAKERKMFLKERKMSEFKMPKLPEGDLVWVLPTRKRRAVPIARFLNGTMART